MNTIDDLYEKCAGLPRYMHEGICEYVENGRPVGGFLQAVISNDLKEACTHADDVNRHLLFEYMEFFYNYAPRACTGSPEAYQAWVTQGGRQGHIKRMKDNELATTGK